MLYCPNYKFLFLKRYIYHINILISHFHFSFSLYPSRHFGKTKKQREMREALFGFLVFVSNIIQLASAAVFLNPLHASFPDLPAKSGNSSIFPFSRFRAVWLPRKRKKPRENKSMTLATFGC